MKENQQRFETKMDKLFKDYSYSEVLEYILNDIKPEDLLRVTLEIDNENKINILEKYIKDKEGIVEVEGVEYRPTLSKKSNCDDCHLGMDTNGVYCDCRHPEYEEDNGCPILKEFDQRFPVYEEVE